MPVFEDDDFDDHEQVVFCRDAASGLTAIIAVHNTNLGPSLGGCRFYPYPGSDAALTGLSRYDTGEKLGDLVLAAEQPLGLGTVVVLGDAAAFSNEVLPRSYEFVGRLLDHLASHGAGPQAWWRQALGLLGCVLLVGLLAWRPDAAMLAGVAVLFSVSLGACLAISHYAGRAVPDGRKLSPGVNRLAYVDASHMEAYSDGDWAEDGIDGLLSTLMRNGYLPLLLPEVTKERLDRAGMLISIAPARGFSAGECKLVADFVEAGGVFICTAGAEDARAVGPLLGQFGVEIPHSPVGPNDKQPEPAPVGELPGESEDSPERFGRFRAYLNAKDYGAGDYLVGVWLFAGWPVRCHSDGRDVLIYDDDRLPLAIALGHGKGRVVVIGDSGFALNHNMGYVGGEPGQGVADNAHFWRWMLTRVTGQGDWIPPKPAKGKPSSGEAERGPGPRLEPPEDIFPSAPAGEVTP